MIGEVSFGWKADINVDNLDRWAFSDIPVPWGSKMAVQVLAGYWDLELQSGDLLLCPRSRKMFGIDGSSPKRLGKLDWLPRVHPDDVPIIDSELEAAGRCNQIYSARFRAVRPDGSICQIIGVGRKVAGDPMRFVGLNFDLATTTESALHETRRSPGAMARLASFLTARSRPANENETPQGGKTSRSIKTAVRDYQSQKLLQRALATMRMRKLRHKFLNPIMLGEPAFDMLLALYVTNASPAILSLRIMSPQLGVPESCAARWLKVLVDDGLAMSVAGDSGEPGSIHAALTDKGRTALDDYFKAFDH